MSKENSTVHKVIKMKDLFKLNIWIIILALCSWTFIAYVAINTKGCVEIDFNRQILRAGICTDN